MSDDFLRSCQLTCEYPSLRTLSFLNESMSFPNISGCSTIIPGYQHIERLNMRLGSITSSRLLEFCKYHISGSATLLDSNEALDTSLMMHLTRYPNPEQHNFIPIRNTSPLQSCGPMTRSFAPHQKLST